MPEPKRKMFGYISVFTNLKMEIAVTDVGNNRFTPFCHRTFSCQLHAFDDFGSFILFLGFYTWFQNSTYII
jgi:hypothetical protein